MTSVAVALLVAELVDDEQQVDEVATSTELLIASVRVGVRTQQFALSLEKEGAATISENSIAVDPTSRLCCGALPKGVGSVTKKWRRNGEKIGKDKMRWGLSHGEKYVRRSNEMPGK